MIKYLAVLITFSGGKCGVDINTFGPYGGLWKRYQVYSGATIEPEAQEIAVGYLRLNERYLHNSYTEK